MISLKPLLVFGLDIAMEVLSGVIALLVGFYAGRGYRLTGERLFLYLNISFLLMGVGLTVDGVAGIYGALMRARGIPPYGVLVAGELFMYACEAAAFIVLAALYTRWKPEVLPAALALGWYNPGLELLLVGLSLYVALQALSRVKIGEGKFVVAGFSLLAVSHLSFMASSLFILAYLLGHAAQLAGFTLFLAVVWEARRSR